jgi:hypothetical protein
MQQKWKGGGIMGEVINLLEFKSRKEEQDKIRQDEMKSLLESVVIKMKGGGIGKHIITKEESLIKLMEDLGIYEY